MVWPLLAALFAGGGAAAAGGAAAGAGALGAGAAGAGAAGLGGLGAGAAGAAGMAAPAAAGAAGGGGGGIMGMFSGLMGGGGGGPPGVGEAGNPMAGPPVARQGSGMGDMVNMAMEKFGAVPDQAGGAIDSAMGGDFSKGYDSYGEGATPETLMKLGDPGGGDSMGEGKSTSIQSLMGMIPSANPKAGRSGRNRPGMKGNDYIRSLMGG